MRKFLVGVLLLLIVTACVPPMAQPSVPVPVVSEPEQTFVWADSSELLTAVPCCQATVDRNTRWLLDQIFDGLVEYAPGSSEIVPNLAESWEVSDDGLTWTFHLRDGVTFSDGTALTAQDVKYSIELALSPQSKVTLRIGGILEIVAVDEHTVVVVTEQPNSAMLHGLQEVAGLVQSPNSTPENPIGTGPYILSEWNRGENVVLERRDNYWGEVPKIETLNYLRRPEATTRVIQLLNGEVDMVGKVPPESISELEQTEGVGVEIPGSSMLVGVRFNTRMPWFDNQLVRQAMNYAVNKRAIVDSLLLGAGYVPDGIAGHGVWGTYRVDYYPYDPDRAAALMQEAGLTLFEGRWHDQGEPVVFRFYVPDGRYVKDRVIGEFVTQQLEDFGLTVELEVAPWSIWASNSRARANALEIDGGMNGFSLVHPVINWANDLHCRNENSRQTGHCDPVFDDLIDRATQTFDEDEQRSLYEQAQQMAIEKAMYLLLYGQSPVWGVRDGIQGLSFTPNEIPITDQVYIE